jgi:hypothetical protein
LEKGEWERLGLGKRDWGNERGIGKMGDMSGGRDGSGELFEGRDVGEWGSDVGLGRFNGMKSKIGSLFEYLEGGELFPKMLVSIDGV